MTVSEPRVPRSQNLVFLTNSGETKLQERNLTTGWRNYHFYFDKIQFLKACIKLLLFNL